MTKRLLDLGCGAGGCSVGYEYAGFEVIGVDIEPQPNYPFAFHQGDMLDFPLEGFDAIHASPPCQGYTTMNNRHGSDAPQLIGPMRERLEAYDHPYVIENVRGAKREMLDPITLTGEMFGLGVHRPRLFDSNMALESPTWQPREPNQAAVYGKCDGRLLWRRVDGSELHVASYDVACEAMGIDWMTWLELCQAIPPAYTAWIGAQLVSA